MDDAQGLARRSPHDAGGSAHDLVAHARGDSVGIAVRDLEPGPAQLVYLDCGEREETLIRESIPFGHKVALTALPGEAVVIEQATAIGLTTRPIDPGALVHIHNLRSARWAPNH